MATSTLPTPHIDLNCKLIHLEKLFGVESPTINKVR